MLPANPAFSRRSDSLVPRTKNLPVAKMFVIPIGVIASLFIIWTVYLFAASKTGFLTAGTIIAVNVGVMFWVHFLLQRFRIGYLPVVLLCAIMILMGFSLGALSGLSPFSSFI